MKKKGYIRSTSKEGGWNCNFCNNNFRTRRELELHKNEIHPKLKGLKESKEFICPFCGRLKKTTKGGETGHEKCCQKNPNRVDGNWKGRHCSEEHKKKVSLKMKQYMIDHPDMVPYVRNHSSKRSYPEIYFRDLLNKENLFSNEELHVSTYFLDFAWPEKRKYLEIDGEQHFVDKRIIEHDKKRTEILKDLGWEVFRIRWSEYQKFSFEEKQEVIKNLKEFLGD